MASFLVPELRNPAKASNLAFNEKIKELLSNGEDICHLAFGQSPFPIPASLVTALQDNAHRGEYLSVAGLPSLRSAISSFHSKHDGTDFSPDQVVTAPGSKELIYLAMRMFDGDVLLASPCWTTYAPQVKLAGKQAIVVDTDFDGEWKLSVANIERACAKSKAENKMIVINNPGNPSGTSYTRQELDEIAEFCKSNNVLILSDEIYGRYNSAHQCMAKIYPEGTLLITGFSKWASAGGWRLGYAVVPTTMPEFNRALVSAASHTFSCAPAPMQAAMAEGLENHSNELEAYMKNTTRILKAVGDFCVRELRTVGVRVHPSQGGFYLMPDFAICKSGLSAKGVNTCEEMCQLMLNEAKVALMAGSCFLRPVDELTTRFCFVDFDGAPALKALEGNEKLFLDEEFVKKFAPKIATGMNRLTMFVKKYAL